MLTPLGNSEGIFFFKKYAIMESTYEEYGRDRLEPYSNLPDGKVLNPGTSV